MEAWTLTVASSPTKSRVRVGQVAMGERAAWDPLTLRIFPPSTKGRSQGSFPINHTPNSTVSVTRKPVKGLPPWCDLGAATIPFSRCTRVIFVQGLSICLGDSSTIQGRYGGWTALADSPRSFPYEGNLFDPLFRNKFQTNESPQAMSSRTPAPSTERRWLC